MHTLILLFLFFASGLTSLIYEVLWLKELGLLFGNTAYATATTLAVFFAGLSVGGYWWGRRASQFRHPLRVYAVLEVGIGLSALLYFALLDLYYLLYGPLFTAVGHQPALFLAVKILLAAGVLFPPAFFMGGTLPVMGQYLIRRLDHLGRTASVLYAVNTIGAAIGAFVAGFYLPMVLGFTNSYLTAIALNLVIAALSYGLSFYKAHVYKGKKKPQVAQAFLADFLARVPAEMQPGFKY
jgi:spermidine synthase